MLVIRNLVYVTSDFPVNRTSLNVMSLTNDHNQAFSHHQFIERHPHARLNIPHSMPTRRTVRHTRTDTNNARQRDPPTHSIILYVLYVSASVCLTASRPHYTRPGPPARRRANNRETPHLPSPLFVCLPTFITVRKPIGLNNGVWLNGLKKRRFSGLKTPKTSKVQILSFYFFLLNFLFCCAILQIISVLCQFSSAR